MKRQACKSVENNCKVTFRFLLIILLCGVLLGTLIFCSLDSEKYSKIQSITGGLLHNKLNYSFLEMLVNSFTGSFLLIALCFFLGYSPIFQPIEMSVLMFRGIGIGLLLSDMYCSFGAYGILISVILILPNAAITGLLLLVAVREAVWMSDCIKLKISSTDDSHLHIDFSLYRTRFLLLIAVLAFVAFVDSLLTVFISSVIMK